MGEGRVPSEPSATTRRSEPRSSRGRKWRGPGLVGTCRSDRHPSIGSLASASWTEEPTSRGFPRVRCPPQVGWVERSETHHRRRSATDGFRCALPILRSLYPSYGQAALLKGVFEQKSEERRVGKEWVSKCRFRGW